MNNLPQTFQFDNQQVRMDAGNAPWFFAQDVANILGYSATSAMLKRLDEDEKKIDTFLDGTTYKKQTLINESGLYSAVLGSQLDSAKRFKKWVTAEVLPSIRKSGKYDLMVPKSFTEALKLAYEQQLQIEEMKPKADFFDAVTGSKTAVDMALAAKTLNMGVGRNALFEFLRNAGVLDRRNIPYQKYCDLGYFRVIESPYTKPDGSTLVSFKTVVYQKGLDFIRRKLAEN